MFLDWLVVINCRANFFISPPAVRLLCFFSLSQLSCFSLTQSFPSLSLFLCLRYNYSECVCVCVCVSPAPRQYVVKRGGGADGDLVMKSGGDGFLLLQPPESDSHSLPLLRLSLSLNNSAEEKGGWMVLVGKFFRFTSFFYPKPSL